MANLNSRVTLHQGHGADTKPEPEFAGTLLEFWSANTDLLFGEMAEIERDLTETGEHRIGGGAAGAFTLRLARDLVPPS